MKKIARFFYLLLFFGAVLAIGYLGWLRKQPILITYRDRFDLWSFGLIFGFVVVTAWKLYQLPYSLKFISMKKVDKMDGEDFEHFVAKLLKRTGFSHVKVTQYDGDQGIDVLANWKGEQYGFQCKRWSKFVGNKAIQEVYSGKGFYDLDKVVVISNSKYTKSARDLAEKLEVELIDREGLINMMQQAK